jgi:hypothetical protein
MGSWYKTCGLSNLPILENEQTYVFVLEQNTDKVNHCYSTHLYRPVLLPFESTYNDYGIGTHSSGIGLGLIIEGIRDNLVELPVGENEYHDIAISKELFNEELFFEGIREGRLSINSYSGKKQVEFTMFRKDIVDNILDTFVIEKYVGKNIGTIGYDNSYVSYQFLDLVKELPLVVSELQKKYHGKYYLLSMENLILPDNLNVTRWFRRDNYRYSKIVHIDEQIGNFLEKNNTQDALELLTQHLKAVFIDHFMELTRKSWIPQSGEGSQYRDTEPYRLLMAAIDRVLSAEESDE